MDSTGSSLPEPKRIRRGERGGCLSMNQELITMTEKWKGLERKTVKQREKADQRAGCSGSDTDSSQGESPGYTGW